MLSSTSAYNFTLSQSDESQARAVAGEITRLETLIENATARGLYSLSYNATVIGNPSTDTQTQNLTSPQRSFNTILVQAGYTTSKNPDTGWWGLNWSTPDNTGAANSGFTTWTSGTTVPSSGSGVNGDFYLRNTTGDIYKKISGSWVIQFNLYSGIPAYTVSTLPSNLAGLRAYVTDGQAGLAWGATVLGGGSTKYECWNNGTAWTVTGK